MKTYEVKTTYTYAGVFKVKAESKAQAKEFIEKHCGLSYGGGIHSTLNDEDIDWDFDMTPDTKVISVK